MRVAHINYIPYPNKVTSQQHHYSPELCSARLEDIAPSEVLIAAVNPEQLELVVLVTTKKLLYVDS